MLGEGISLTLNLLRKALPLVVLFLASGKTCPAAENVCELLLSECLTENCSQLKTNTISLEIAPEFSGDYHRAEFTGGVGSRGWADIDSDCQDTRTEVLIKDSQIPVVLGANGCWVKSGLWYDFLSDRTFENPTDVEIDHLVALKEAHESGAFRWPSSQKIAFANDLAATRNLNAIWFSTNRSKGARDPSEWMPPSRASACKYVTEYIEVKKYWGLSVDIQECAAMKQTLDHCPG